MPGCCAGLGRTPGHDRPAQFACRSTSQIIGEFFVVAVAGARIRPGRYPSLDRLARRNGWEGVMTTEQFETRSKKGRGMARRSLDLIKAMYAAAGAAQPITGRGIGYKLFAWGLIPSMARSEMQRVYRLLKEAREREIIPWEWIADETRALERCSTWDDPADYARCVARSYRRDFWNQQPIRCEVWSEKGTVRGVLAPVLDHFAVGFRVMHGFSGAPTIYDVSQDDDGRELIALYVGDLDPSGMFVQPRPPCGPPFPRARPGWSPRPRERRAAPHGRDGGARDDGSGGDGGGSDPPPQRLLLSTSDNGRPT